MVWTIITGASSGIGMATAYRLAKIDFSSLLLISRNDTSLGNLASSLRDITSKNVEYLALNVSSLSSQETLSKWMAEKASVRNLVNAAGIGAFSPLKDTTIDRFNSVISTNLEGVFLTTQCFVQNTIPDGETRTIINVSSDADSVGFPDASSYCASKFGVLGLSRTWQKELRPENIRVCNLSPGRVDTNFNGKKPGMRPGALSADEVAEVIMFILSCSHNIELTQISMDSLGRIEQ